MTFKTDRTVNINLSDVVIQNLMESMKEWERLNSLKTEGDDNDLFGHINEYQNATK